MRIFPSSLTFAEPSGADCTPPAKKDAAASLAAPVVSEPGVCVNRNAAQWHHIAEFLDAQHLESLGLRRVSRRADADKQERALAPACSAAAVRSIPDGNHGDNNLRTVSGVA